MKTKTYLIVSIALLMGMSVLAQDPAAVSVYEDCSKNGKTYDFRPTTGTENGHTWVDLGLPSGLKWASCNVGATTPEDYGDYFAWGETETKTYYSWETYKYGNGDWDDDKLTKYCTDARYGDNGFTDDKTTLELKDDAAHVNWGGSWRMPTSTEVDELIGNCTWTWTTQNGVYGYQVTSKTNGNSIFLRDAGYLVGTYHRDDGYYWSSSLLDYGPNSARDLQFSYGGVGRGNNYRCYGCPVRPVCP